MALSLKSDLVNYFEIWDAKRKLPPPRDKKGDSISKFNMVNQYTKKVSVDKSGASSPLFNKYPIGFLPDNPFARQPEGFNPNLITNLIPKK